MDTPSSSSPYSPWRRSVKRKLETAPLEAAEGAGMSDPSQLRAVIAEKEEQILDLSSELDAERESSEIAAREAMAKITRLQQEKSAAQMELRQAQRSADALAADFEALEEEAQTQLEEYTRLAESYRQRLIDHGLDPDDDDNTKPQAVAGKDDGGKAAKSGIVGSSSSPISVLEKETVEEKAYARSQHSSEEGFVSELTGMNKPQSYPVVSMNVNGEVHSVNRFYGNGEVDARNLHLRLAALESDRNAMRKAVVALWAEQAQLVVLKEMAMQRYREVAASDRRGLVRKKPLFTSFSSMLGMLKFAIALISQKRKSKTKYAIGLSVTLAGLLIMLQRTTKIRQWRFLLLPGARA